MDIDSGKLYSQDEVKAMSKEDREKLTWISRREYDVLRNVDESKRRKALLKMRAQDEKAKKKRRKAQKKARKKNR